MAQKAPTDEYGDMVDTNDPGIPENDNRDPYTTGRRFADTRSTQDRANTPEQEAYISGLNTHGALNPGSGFDSHFGAGETNDQYAARLNQWIAGGGNENAGLGPGNSHTGALGRDYHGDPIAAMQMDYHGDPLPAQPAQPQQAAQNFDPSMMMGLNLAPQQQQQQAQPDWQQYLRDAFISQLMGKA